MEARVSEILENILSLLGLEGSFEVEEKEEAVFVSIDTPDAGKLIGHQGETLTALQLIINLAITKEESYKRSLSSDEVKQSLNPSQASGYKKVIIDIASWKKSKEEELAHRARMWAKEVIETGEEMELIPMPSWQRRIVHMTIQETEGVDSESEGLGEERHLVIKPVAKTSKKASDKKTAKAAPEE